MASETGQGDPIVIRARSKSAEGRKRVDMLEAVTQDPDTHRYIEKQLHDKGVLRMERRPVDGLGIGKPRPKSGRGGKFTWEGPIDLAEAELDPAPPTLGEHDPNYVEEERRRWRRGKQAEGEGAGGGGSEDVAAAVAGEVEVAKAAEARAGVSRIVVRPPLQPK